VSIDHCGHFRCNCKPRQDPNPPPELSEHIRQLVLSEKSPWFTSGHWQHVVERLEEAGLVIVPAAEAPSEHASHVPLTAPI
jgi:hypothetical protein